MHAVSLTAFFEWRIARGDQVVAAVIPLELMSTWLFGHVECRLNSDSPEWYATIDAGVLITGGYDLYACLFGVRNYANFTPLFHDRGIPDDCCESIRESFAKYGDEMHSSTFCTLEELKKIDKTELANEPDQRQHYMKKTPNGHIRVKGFPSPADNPEPATVMSRAEALDNDGFNIVYDLMNTLGEHVGEENVRLVVWFD